MPLSGFRGQQTPRKRHSLCSIICQWVKQLLREQLWGCHKSCYKPWPSIVWPNYSADNNLPDSLHRQIIRQAVQLQNRQKQNSATQSEKLSDNGNNNDAIPDMIEMLDQRLMPEPVLQPEKSLHNPLINALTMGQYEASRKLFMQQSLQHQLEMVDELAELPDYLGVDYSTEPLTQLKSDLQKATSSLTTDNDEITDLQSFALSQRAWQLLNNLYDAKIAVPKEAMNRVKIQAMINPPRSY